MADAAPTEVIPVVRQEDVAVSEQPKKRRSRSTPKRVLAWLTAPDSPSVIYIGLAFIVAGFVMIAFAWSKVAATLALPLQIPYMVSGGFAGLGLVAVGIGIVSIGAKRRDNHARVRQIEKLGATLDSIRDAVEGADAEERDDA